MTAAPRIGWLLLGLLPGAVLWAQQPIGSVATDQAEVAGLVSVSAGTATIQNSGSVTAGKRTAQIALNRGGAIAVCSSSTIHLSQSNASVPSAPLLVALERGAAELRWSAQRSDSIMTPDLLLELSEAAPIDLRIRVVSNGDTCIENAGKNAPLIHAVAQFTAGGYLIKPGQRVLFEHGSVREVVDKESASCGCPPDPPAILADVARSGTGGEPNAFPEAVSAGLAQPEVPAATPAGKAHTQVAATLDYNGKTDPVAGAPAGPPAATPVDGRVGNSPGQPEEPQQKRPNILRRFLRRLAGRG